MSFLIWSKNPFSSRYVTHSSHSRSIRIKVLFRRPARKLSKSSPCDHLMNKAQIYTQKPMQTWRFGCINKSARRVRRTRLFASCIRLMTSFRAGKGIPFTLATWKSCARPLESFRGESCLAFYFAHECRSETKRRRWDRPWLYSWQCLVVVLNLFVACMSFYYSRHQGQLCVHLYDERLRKW